MFGVRTRRRGRRRWARGASRAFPDGSSWTIGRNRWRDGCNSSTVRSAKRVSPLRRRAAGAVVRLDAARVLAPHGLAVQGFLAGGAEPGQYSESLPWRVAQARNPRVRGGAGGGGAWASPGDSVRDGRARAGGTLRGAKRANPRRRRRPTLPGSPRRAALGSICRPRPAGRPATTRGPDRGGGIVARGRGLVARGRQAAPADACRVIVLARALRATAFVMAAAGRGVPVHPPAIFNTRCYRLASELAHRHGS